MADRPSWPWPGDTPLERARRIANSLLTYLTTDHRQQVVTMAHAYGEMWLGESVVIYADDQAITTQQAAEMFGVPEYEVRRWATMRHPEDPERVLLPRYGRDGKWTTYLVEHLREARAALRRTRHGEAT